MVRGFWRQKLFGVQPNGHVQDVFNGKSETSIKGFVEMIFSNADTHCSIKK